jgi:multidrug efflux pump subunit AcrA (membrane-fusion protein)
MNVTGKLPNALRSFKRPRLPSKLREALTRLPKFPRTVGWIALGIIVLAVGGLSYYELVYLPSRTAAEPALQTATVSQGTLVISATGSGTLIARKSVDLAFTTGGTVTEVNVKVSDEVKVGDLLAKIDDADARIQYAEAKRSLADLTSDAAIASAQSAVATAQGDVVDAVQHLEYDISPSVMHWENEVTSAQQALKDAQAQAAASPTDKDAQAALEKAQAALENAKTNLTGARDDYDRYVKANFTYMVMDSQTHKKKKYVAEPTAADILSARASVAEAQAALKEANWLYAALTGGDVPENATGTDLAALEQAKLNLETAQTELNGTQLTATIAGTVMSVDISVGDSVKSDATVISISDLSGPYLQVYLDESDWSNIKTDAEADVTFDILPDQTFKGTVTQVDPGLYTENGSSVVRAYVEISGDEASGLSLPLGTTATVDVIGAKAENAVLVPVDALHETSTGKYAVFVMENGIPTLRTVEIGIQDTLYAEVKSGLEAGDIVTTGVTETTTK